ncbi:Neuropeptide Y receptor, partial [Orchesella cincta]
KVPIIMALLNWLDSESGSIKPSYFINTTTSGGGVDKGRLVYHSGESAFSVSTLSPILQAGLDYLSGQVSISDHNLTANTTSLSSAAPSTTPAGVVGESGSGNVTVNPYSGDSGDLYEVPLSIIIVLSLLYGSISATALIGNMLVLWVVTVSRRMRTVTNMFIANLALADIIIGLFAIPFQFQAALLQRWNLPDFMCAFCPFVQILSVNVSVFTLSAIAVDRYRAVLFPLSARASKRKATWAILSIWSVGILLALPTEVDYKVTHIMDKGKLKPFCANLGLSSTFRTYYTLGIVIIQYFFPLIIITGAYAHMATKLWGTTAPGNKEESRDAVVLRNKKKVIKMLALVVLLFALCWLPLQMYQYINIIWFCFHWLAMSNSCYNPFIYAIYNDKFQREFRARLWCFRKYRRNGEDGNYSEASDFDRSKIRASYRFTNNRSMRNNRQSVYSGARTSMSDFRRDSSFHSRTALNNHRLSCDRTGSSLGQQVRQNLNGQYNHHHLSPDYDSYAGCNGNGKYLSVGSSYCGGVGSSNGSTFLDSNGRIQLDTSTMVSEIESDNLRNEIEQMGNGCNGTLPYESSSSKSPTTAVAVITTNCRPMTNGNHKTLTVEGRYQP